MPTPKKTKPEVQSPITKRLFNEDSESLQITDTAESIVQPSTLLNKQKSPITKTPRFIEEELSPQKNSPTRVSNMLAHSTSIQSAVPLQK